MYFSWIRHWVDLAEGILYSTIVDSFLVLLQWQFYLLWDKVCYPFFLYRGRGYYVQDDWRKVIHGPNMMSEVFIPYMIFLTEKKMNPFVYWILQRQMSFCFCYASFIMQQGRLQCSSVIYFYASVDLSSANKAIAFVRFYCLDHRTCVQCIISYLLGIRLRQTSWCIAFHEHWVSNMISLYSTYVTTCTASFSVQRAAIDLCPGRRDEYWNLKHEKNFLWFLSCILNSSTRCTCRLLYLLDTI